MNGAYFVVKVDILLHYQVSTKYASFSWCPKSNCLWLAKCTKHEFVTGNMCTREKPVKDFAILADYPNLSSFSGSRLTNQNNTLILIKHSHESLLVLKYRQLKSFLQYSIITFSVWSTSVWIQFDLHFQILKISKYMPMSTDYTIQ